TGGLTGAEMDWYWRRYLPDGLVEGSMELAPIDADLSGLPPTLLLTAEHDSLRDEGEALAAAIAAAGVTTVATRYVGMVHGFFTDPQLFDASTVALEQVGAWANTWGT
ncbi:MAG: acetyl esterase, partial [Nocardioidaceae bacterium]|nr:acetyl esterase [Nocardioidaceae bacterium]